MRILRTLLLLLLSLALPAYGSAGVAFESPCTMAIAAMDQASAVGPAADAQTLVQHDTHDGANLCKSGPDCKTGKLLLQQLPVLALRVPSHHAAPPARGLAPASPGAADIWRPPAAS